MWDLPRPEPEPVSPALAGRFSTTAPPGKPHTSLCFKYLSGKSLSSEEDEEVTQDCSFRYHNVSSDSLDTSLLD